MYGRDETAVEAAVSAPHDGVAMVLVQLEHDLIMAESSSNYQRKSDVTIGG